MSLLFFHFSVTLTIIRAVSEAEELAHEAKVKHRGSAQSVDLLARAAKILSRELASDSTNLLLWCKLMKVQLMMVKVRLPPVTSVCLGCIDIVCCTHAKHTDDEAARARVCADFEATLQHLPPTLGERACGEIKFCFLQLLRAAKGLDAVTACRYWVRAMTLLDELAQQERDWVMLKCAGDAPRKLARIRERLQQYFTLLVHCVSFPSDYDAVMNAMVSVMPQCPLKDIVRGCEGGIVPKAIWLAVMLAERDATMREVVQNWFSVHCARECDVSDLTYVGVDDDAARRALSFCPAASMESLMLRNTIVSDALLLEGATVARFVALSSLSLSQCNIISSGGVVSAMTLLPSLTQLRIVDW